MVKSVNNNRLRLRLVLLCAWLLGFADCYAQYTKTINLESCYQLAERNYPLIQQQSLIEKSNDFSIINASKGNLPRLFLTAQGSYQSDVTQIPIALPAVSRMDKDQYKLYAELTQPLTNLWIVKSQRELIQANTLVAQQKLSVDLYQLKERINQLYFGVLLLDAQLELTAIVKQDILLGLTRNAVAVANGIALKSSTDLLLAEQLTLEQRLIEYSATRNGYVAMLALFINQDIQDATVFERPKSIPANPVIKRPELQLFDFQKQTYKVQSRLLDRQSLPQLNLFLQAGYGRPALNMLNNAFDFYYLTGLRLNWNISNFYTLKQDKQLLDINQQALEIQKETFLYNTALKMLAEKQELTKLEALIRQDAEIIQLRERILGTSHTQLEYGTITTLDYLRNVHAADQARLNRAWHSIDLLRAQYQFQNTIGQY